MIVCVANWRVLCMCLVEVCWFRSFVFFFEFCFVVCNFCLLASLQFGGFCVVLWIRLGLQVHCACVFKGCNLLIGLKLFSVCIGLLTWFVLTGCLAAAVFFGAMM